MNDFLLVCVRKRVREPGYDLEYVHKFWLVEIQIVKKVLALNVLHRQVIDVIVHGNFVNGNDARVVELCHGTRLTHEPFHETAVDGNVGRHDLERHLAVKIELDCLVYHRHPAAVDLLDDAILADNGANGQKRPLDVGKHVADINVTLDGFFRYFRYLA